MNLFIFVLVAKRKTLWISTSWTLLCISSKEVAQGKYKIVQKKGEMLFKSITFIDISIPLSVLHGLQHRSQKGESRVQSVQRILQSRKCRRVIYLSLILFVFFQTANSG